MLMYKVCKMHKLLNKSNFSCKAALQKMIVLLDCLWFLWIYEQSFELIYKFSPVFDLLFSLVLRRGHTALLIPLTSIHTHANASDRKLVRKVSHFTAFQSSSLVNSDLRIHITWNRVTDSTSIRHKHDLVAELKEHKFKTAALQESGVDCMFLHFRSIIICHVLNLGF